ncbi:hypothetical protein DFH06DRAFT_1327946 [Mycena polygramma]|nr:hypothetical protein DFH06DRAFT_1327946 [Mycena polygramma]
MATLDYAGASNLTDLTLVNVWMSNVNAIPWSQLTRYCEVDCEWTANTQERLPLYRNLLNLVLLSLAVAISQGRETPSFFDTDTRAVVLPNLRVACFRLNNLTGNNILRCLEMPALEKFSIEDSDSHRFGSCMPSSSPRLKVLRVQAQIGYVGHDEEERALGLFPDLTELSIDAPNLITEPEIVLLIPSSGQLALGRKLEIIRLSNASFFHQGCWWDTLLAMLRARFRPTVEGISQLRTFEFSTDAGGDDQHVTAGLRTLGAQNHWDIRLRRYGFAAWDALHLEGT